MVNILFRPRKIGEYNLPYFIFLLLIFFLPENNVVQVTVFQWLEMPMQGKNNDFYR